MSYKSVSEWAMVNGYIQCTGCKGFDKQENALWLHSKKYNTVMSYCTIECRDDEVIA